MAGTADTAAPPTVPIGTPPDSFTPRNAPSRQRAIFSRSARRLGTHVVEGVRGIRAQGRTRQSYHADQHDGLQILRELSDQSFDSIYKDASLTSSAHRNESRATRVLTDILIFLLCTAIGVAATAAVETLHENGRHLLRLKLASQLSLVSDRRTRLSNQVGDLKAKVEKQTERLDKYSAVSPKTRSDQIATASTAVTGPGAIVTLASATQATRQKGRVVSSFAQNAVSDVDLQETADLLWQGGAEAISLNGRRLGPQTSIRHAGSVVLVGTETVTPPYTFYAIGNAPSLVGIIDHGIGKSLVDALSGRGITLQVRVSDRPLVLPAAKDAGTSVAKAGTGKSSRKGKSPSAEKSPGKEKSSGASGT